MVDLALQLNWKGKDSVYEGESKNIALLYEYWLFFELVKVIKSIDGCVIEETDRDSFQTFDKGKLVISLQEGKKSCQSFSIPSFKTKINLYYNRTFSPEEFSTTKYEGSYSRPFRPDYTLAIFPDTYSRGNHNGENEAVRDGAVSYIHFDAKYRITDLTALIGSDNQTEEAAAKELNAEKTDEVTNTYKRGDLLKMHTYNDAIRRTIGSYVLYPGSGNQENKSNHVFSLYDEILPGVGAFAIKPSIHQQSESELKKFITALISEKIQRGSRLNRLKYYSEMILQEPAYKSHSLNVEDAEKYNNIGSGDFCVIGYIRADRADDYYFMLRNSGFLSKGKEFLFYYYAIKDRVVYSHHHDIAKATRFRFFTNNIDSTGTYHLDPVVCEIESTGLVSKEDLVKELCDQGYETDVTRHHADFYYVMKVRVVNDNAEEKELKVDDVNSENGNDSFSPHSPKVLPLEEVV
jgi:hypothetical protein